MRTAWKLYKDGLPGAMVAGSLSGAAVGVHRRWNNDPFIDIDEPPAMTVATHALGGLAAGVFYPITSLGILFMWSITGPY